MSAETRSVQKAGKNNTDSREKQLQHQCHSYLETDGSKWNGTGGLYAFTCTSCGTELPYIAPRPKHAPAMHIRITKKESRRGARCLMSERELTGLIAFDNNLITLLLALPQPLEKFEESYVLIYGIAQSMSFRRTSPRKDEAFTGDSTNAHSDCVLGLLLNTNIDYMVLYTLMHDISASWMQLHEDSTATLSLPERQ